jgi:hypothetical protein
MIDSCEAHPRGSLYLTLRAHATDGQSIGERLQVLHRALPPGFTLDHVSFNLPTSVTPGNLVSPDSTATAVEAPAPEPARNPEPAEVAEPDATPTAPEPAATAGGEPPWEGDGRQSSEQDAPAADAAGADLSPSAVRAWVDQLLADDSSRRAGIGKLVRATGGTSISTLNPGQLADLWAALRAEFPQLPESP